MSVRIISSVIAIPLLIFFVLVGGLPLQIAVLVLSLFGMYELFKAVSGKIKAVHFVGFGLEAVYSLLLYASLHSEHNYLLIEIFFIVLIVAILLILMLLVFAHKTTNIYDASVTLFGFFYVGVLLSLICRLGDIKLYSWLPFIFAFGSDTGAYFCGKAFGKHKLTPELSPKKTVEGSVGGIITVAILTGIYMAVCSNIYDFININHILGYSIVGAVGAAFSQIGDLAASSIKRFTGIKDFGKLMPGHGGVLDRFDSVLFTLPIVYLALQISSLMS